MSRENGRRGFLRRLSAVAGVSFVPRALEGLLVAPYSVDFVTHFPQRMTRDEYQSHKSQFENKDKVTVLLSAFKKSGKIRSTEFAFHGTHSIWRVVYASERDFKEWMNLTEETGSHLDDKREIAGFFLEIRTPA